MQYGVREKKHQADKKLRHHVRQDVAPENPRAAFAELAGNRNVLLRAQL